MLTRRHIRVKVMQSIYALYQEENHNLQKEEKFLLRSIENMHSLYATLMGLWGQLYQRGEELLKISENKYFSSEETKKRNQKFVANRALKLIVENEPLQELISEHCAINWRLHTDYIAQMYDQILASERYNRYMKAPYDDFKNDKFLLVDIYEECIATDERLYEFLEEGAMTWLDDFPTINTFIIKLLKDLKSENKADFFTPKLYKDLSDKDFALELLRKTVLNDEKYHEYLKSKSGKWDINRMAILDVITIKMAIAEFLKFPSIPVKVTINEYVEIVKEYSTPKSSVFINGILDTLSKEFAEKEMLNKIGRGLL